jgi:hypothetical protein
LLCNLFFAGDLLEAEQNSSMALKRTVSELERQVEDLGNSNSSLSKQVGCLAAEVLQQASPCQLSETHSCPSDTFAASSGVALEQVDMPAACGVGHMCHINVS